MTDSTGQVALDAQGSMEPALPTRATGLHPLLAEDDRENPERFKTVSPGGFRERPIAAGMRNLRGIESLVQKRSILKRTR